MGRSVFAGIMWRKCRELAKTRQGGYACWRGDRRGATVGEIGSIAGIVYKADVMIVCGDQQIRSEGRKKNYEGRKGAAWFACRIGSSSFLRWNISDAFLAMYVECKKKRQIEIGCTYTRKELEEPESDWTFCMESKAIKK